MELWSPWAKIAAGVFWSLVALAILSACVASFRADTRLSDADEACRSAGNRVEYFYSATGDVNRVDCFDRTTNQRLASTGRH